MDSYIYIRTDGHSDEINSLDDIISSVRPYIKYFLRRKGLKRNFVSEDGQMDNPLQIGNFRLLYYSVEDAGQYAPNRRVTFCIEDTERNQVQEKYVSIKNGYPPDSLIIKTIVPILQKIADYGSIPAYNTVEELERLRQENAKLKEKLAQLTNH